jgi:hypothetical protein
MSASFIKYVGYAPILALALLLSACQWDVGTVEVRLVYTADVISGFSLNPLDRQKISDVRVRIEGDGMSTRRTEFALGAHERGAFSDIPLGKNRVVTVEGVNNLGDVQSRGISAPFDTRSGNTKIYLFISLVGNFAPPPREGINEKEFQEKYRTTSELTRVFHTSTSLPGGEVLVVGGAWHPNKDGFLKPLDEVNIGSAELFSPSAGAFVGAQASPDCIAMRLCMLVGRAFHTTELLSSGSHALVIGGEPLPDIRNKPVEVYSVETETFDNYIGMPVPRTRHASARVTGSRDGVLVAGGIGGSQAEALPNIELFEGGNFVGFDPELREARSGAVAVSYADNVLIIGGWEDENTASKWVDHIEFTGQGGISHTPFEMKQARAEHSAVLVEDTGGNPVVFVCGGLWDDGTSKQVVDSCEFLYPTENQSELIPGISLRRWGHTATVLKDGSVLVAGGFDYYGNPLTAAGGAILFPTTVGVESSRPISTFSARAGHTATLLSNGMVVLIGGISKIDVGGETVFEYPTYYYEIFNP